MPRFITESEMAELIDLYWLANTALSGKSPPFSPPVSHWDRVSWACKEWAKAHPERPHAESVAYKELDTEFAWKYPPKTEHSYSVQTYFDEEGVLRIKTKKTKGPKKSKAWKGTKKEKEKVRKWLEERSDKKDP